MKKVLIASAAMALALSAAPVAMAAHAGAPYRNVDRANDAGNDTGDNSVDALNAAQLDQNYKGPYYPAGSAPPMASPPPPMADSDAPPPPRTPMRRPIHRPMPARSN